MPTPIASKLKAAAKSSKDGDTVPSAPVWAGPCSDAPNGGVTFSLLSRFLNCPERFRLMVIEGIKAADAFNHRLGFGTMWHICEESLAKVSGTKGIPGDLWKEQLRLYAIEQCRLYPMQKEEIDKWYNVCKVTFPIYVEYWKKHQDVVNRKPFMEEVPFCVRYQLPSGRSVCLRGKLDSVDLVKEGNAYGVWLMENKTKSDIQEGLIQRQIRFDLQTQLYLVALGNLKKSMFFYGSKNSPPSPAKFFDEAPIMGVRYNVIRRPLSGGKGSIVQGKGTQGSKCPKCRGEGKVVSKTVLAGGLERCPKCKGAKRLGGKPPETKEAYYKRLADIIKECPEDFFMRWKITISEADVELFKRTCLDQLLERLCDWYEYVTGVDDIWQPKQPYNRYHNRGLHWRHPFGVYNSIDELGYSDLDNYLETGSMVGLQRTTELFPELTGTS